MTRIMDKTTTVYVVGPFPPPRHGVSTINETMAELVGGSAVCVRLDTAVRSLNRSLFVRSMRVWRILCALIKLLTSRKGRGNTSVYMSLSGGWGLGYEACIAWAARMIASRLVLHHNSYSYIESIQPRMRFLVAAAGPGALHIALAPGMREVLTQEYGCARVEIISNAAFIVAGQPAPTGERCLTVGYLCNLAFEKGIEDIMTLAKLALQQHHNFRFVIAGPFENPTVERFFRSALDTLPNASYVGPVYGARKTAFFEQIDVFAFPTRYRNEAEPLVILEALSYGCPVVAYDRGCIANQLKDGAGLVVERETHFAERCIAQLSRWDSDRVEFERSRLNARRRFERLKLEADAQTRQLVQMLTGATPTGEN